MNAKVPLLAPLLGALILQTGAACQRANQEQREVTARAPVLSPDRGHSKSAEGVPKGSVPLATAQPAGQAPQPIPTTSTPRLAPAEAPPPDRTTPEDRLSTDPRHKRPDRPQDDGGQVGHLRLDMPPPPPLALTSAGDEPRRAFRYQLREGDLLVWEAEVSQRTELRSERSCPPPSVSAPPSTPPLQTIPLSYRVQVTSRVTSALPERFTLETSFRKVRLTLPPGLSEQSELLSSLVTSASYVQTLTRTGRTESFLLGKLTGVGMKSLLDRLRSPFGMVQPVLPVPAVGPGAAWSQVHRLVLPQPGGRVAAHYVATYQLTRLGGDGAVAHLQVSTTVSLDGQVMGEAYRGQGQGQGRVELDAARGILRAASGEMTICTAVMGRSSRTHTRYSQTFLVAESKLGNGDSPPSAPPARPGLAPASGSPPGPPPAPPPAPTRRGE